CSANRRKKSRALDGLGAARAAAIRRRADPRNECVRLMAAASEGATFQARFTGWLRLRLV
ncbi:MAG: hypothetical protein R6X17_04400, partial [Candidatus Competibacteraceae bacterium]